MKKKIHVPTAKNNEELLRWHSDVFFNKEQGEKIYKDIRYNFKSSPHPFCGWRGVPNQNLDTLQINRYGLRSSDFEFSSNKKDICVLLGGSVAWGYGATNNDFTPSYLIQKYLKQNGLDFQMVCLAQNSHNSFDELKSFISTVDELNPKLVITLSGVNDIWQIAKRNYNKTQLLHNFLIDFFNWGQSMGIIFTYKDKLTTFLKLIVRFFKQKSISYEHSFYQFGHQSNLPIKLFSHKLDTMNAYCRLKKIKLVHILQPHLFFKKNKSKTEKEYLDYWVENKTDNIINYDIFIKYLTMLRDLFFYVSSEKSYSEIIYINALDFFDNYTSSIFFDVAHMSDYGNDILAKRVSKIIIESKLL